MAHWPASSRAEQPGAGGKRGSRSDGCSPAHSGSKPPGVGCCKTVGMRLHNPAGRRTPAGEARCMTVGTRWCRTVGLRRLAGADNPVVGVGRGTPAAAGVGACRENKKKFGSTDV